MAVGGVGARELVANRSRRVEALARSRERLPRLLKRARESRLERGRWESEPRRRRGEARLARRRGLASPLERPAVDQSSPPARAREARRPSQRAKPERVRGAQGR